MEVRNAVAVCVKTFTVVPPTGVTVCRVSDPGLGLEGPPDKYIGNYSVFRLTVTPSNVCFNNVLFRENIPRNEWTWPNGTRGEFGPKTVGTTVAIDNACRDDCWAGPHPIERIHDGTGYVDFYYVLRVPLEYHDGTNWLGFLDATHPQFYRGRDQKSQVVSNNTNSASGKWQGPWQSDP